MSHSLHVLILFVYIPILGTYPTTYVWYDYNTNDNLATDTSEAVSELIIILGMAKVVFYFSTLIFIIVRSKTMESQAWIQRTNFIFITTSRWHYYY